MTLEELENRIDRAQCTLNTLQEVVEGLKDSLEELKEEHKEPEFDLYGWNPCNITVPNHVLEDPMFDFVAVLLMHKDVYEEYKDEEEGYPVYAGAVKTGKVFLGYAYFPLTNGKLVFKYPSGSPIFNEQGEHKLDPNDYYFKYVFGRS